MELPKSVRSYIDNHADEFKELDAWTKIAQIAYRIKRGAGAELLTDFKEDIERHLENPAYGCYEDTAKKSIASYIEMLRTGGKYYMSVIALPKKSSFSSLFHLLTEEILYRYWEKEIDDDKVECHFDDAYYDYKEIASRYKGETAKRDFIKYISTSQETLRNIEVDEDNIKRKNGWAMLADSLYGNTIWSDKEEDERIYPGDEAFIHSFNKKVELKYQYVVGIPPMPFSGNLLNAKVVVLTLNPGYIEAVNKDICDAMSKGEKEQLLCLMRNALILNGVGIYDCSKSSRVQGNKYWEKAFDRLAMEAYGRPSSEMCHPIYRDIAFFQLVGYHSEKFRYAVGVKHMPSTIFTNLLLKYLATKTDKTFLILRSETLWREALGCGLWSKLETEGRIITKGHKGMSQKISRGNLKKNNGYDKLVNILKQK